MHKLISLLVFVFVMLFGVAVAIVNTEMVAFNYYIGVITVPLSLLLVTVFIAGVVFTLILSSLMMWNLKLKLKRNQSRLHKYEIDQANLINAINK